MIRLFQGITVHDISILGAFILVKVAPAIGQLSHPDLATRASESVYQWFRWFAEFPAGLCSEIRGYSYHRVIGSIQEFPEYLGKSFQKAMWEATDGLHLVNGEASLLDGFRHRIIGKVPPTSKEVVVVPDMD